MNSSRPWPQALFAVLVRGIATLIGVGFVGELVTAFTNIGHGSFGILGLVLFSGLLLAPAAWLLWKAAAASAGGGWKATWYSAGAIPLALLGFLLVGIAFGDTIGDAAGIQTLAARGTTIALFVAFAGTVLAAAVSLIPAPRGAK